MELDDVVELAESLSHGRQCRALVESGVAACGGEAASLLRQFSGDWFALLLSDSVADIGHIFDALRSASDCQCKIVSSGGIWCKYKTCPQCHVVIGAAVRKALRRS